MLTKNLVARFTRIFLKSPAVLNCRSRNAHFSSVWNNKSAVGFVLASSLLAASGTAYLLSESRIENPFVIHGYSKDADDDDDVKSKKRKARYEQFKQMNFIADIVEEVSPSVVFLECPISSGYRFQPTQMSSGSGFIVDADDGIILTNAHVIANSRQVIVKFNNGRSVEGVVEYSDDRLDLATVRVPSKVLKDLPPLKLASGKSRAGEWVIAVGAPFTLSNTVTVGVISSISRGARELGINDNIDYIQTDASINVGNSGGPLLNLEGDVVGINTLKVGEGISFAVPADYAVRFLDRCKSFRHPNSWFGTKHNNKQGAIPEFDVPVPTKRKYLGLTMITLTPNLIASTRSSDRDFPDVKTGVLIYRVVLGSPAHIGGLRAGDVVQSINGRETQRTDDVYKALETAKELSVRVRRKHEEILLKVQPQNVD